MQAIEQQDWVKGNYHPVAIIGRTMGELAARFQFAVDEYDQDGLGAARGKMMKTAGGRPFVIEQLLQAPSPWNDQTTIHCEDDARTMDSDLQDILTEMQVKPDELTWVHEDIDAVRLSAALAPAASTPPGPKGPAAPAPC